MRPRLRDRLDRGRNAPRMVDAEHRAMTWLAARPRASLVVQLVRDVVRVQGQTRTSLAAAGAALWLVIALFPAVTAVVSIFGLVVGPDDVAKAISNITDKGQGSLSEAVTKQLEQVSSSATSSLSIGLALSVLVSLWSVSNGSYNLIRAIRQSFGLPPQPYLAARFLGFVGGVLGVLGMGVAAFAASASAVVNESVSGVMHVLATGVSAVATLAIMAALLVALYRFALRSAAKSRTLIPGAVLATAALGLLGAGLTLTVTNLGSAVSVYGVAAGAVGALISVYFAAYIVLLGAIVNAQWPSTSWRIAAHWTGSELPDADAVAAAAPTAEPETITTERRG